MKKLKRYQASNDAKIDRISQNVVKFDKDNVLQTLSELIEKMIESESEKWQLMASEKLKNPEMLYVLKNVKKDTKKTDRMMKDVLTNIQTLRSLLVMSDVVQPIKEGLIFLHLTSKLS